MKPSDAAKEIIALLEESARRGGRAPSTDLIAFLDELSLSSGLKKTERRSRRPSTGERATRVARPRRPTDKAAMSKTIDELAKKLSDAFGSDSSFEAIMNEPTLQKLSKPNVVTLFNRVFQTSREFPKSLSKPDLFNEIRRERISRVRSGF